jgi:hypothetical protein
MAGNVTPVNNSTPTVPPAKPLYRRVWSSGYGRLAAVLLPLLLLAALLVMCRRLEPKPSGPVVPGIAKILVAENGFYHLTLDDLQAAGLEGALSQENFHLSQGGAAVPYLLAEDRLIFYGQAPTSRYTAVRPYLLESGRVGMLMAEEEIGQPVGEIGRTVSQTARLEENHVYDSRARLPDGREPWFWATLQVQSRLPLTFDLAAAPTSESAGATLRLALWGASHNPGVQDDHDFDLILNGQTLATVRWDGESYYVAELAVPAGALRQGENELVLDNAREGATLVDVMRLDWIELRYAAPAEAVGDQLAFAGGTGAVTLAGFSQEPYLFDVTDPGNPVRLVGWQWEGEEARLATEPGRPLVAIGPDGLRRPASMAGLRQSNWSNTSQQADLLIVTTDELAPALAPLVAARQEQGLTVVLVPAEEIYDEFGYGEDSPDSIRAFVSYAYQEWAEPAPRYLLLVGEATYDYRGYEGEPAANQVPTFLIPVEYSGETVSDARLADVSGDARPEVAVGRWPVSSRDEVSQLVERTLAYEQGEAAGRALFSADGTSSEFSTLTDNILQASAFPAGQTTKLYGAPAGQLLQEWAGGAWLVAYTGHGSLDMWGKDDVFSLAAVPELESAGAPPIVVQFTCLTGFFAHPQSVSISEAMLGHDDGPVLLVAATSLTLSSSQEPFAVALLRALQDPEVERAGDALQAAKLALDVAGNDNLREISDTFGLLGDPSTIIQRPPSPTP